eukprot:364810-Chlamydomonas_euryale.AAC.20
MPVLSAARQRGSSSGLSVIGSQSQSNGERAYEGYACVERSKTRGDQALNPKHHLTAALHASLSQWGCPFPF